jgi:hypothetical protein
MSKQSRQVTSRVPVTPETLERLKEFRNGLDGSYDDAINRLLDLASNGQADLYIVGRNMREAERGEKANS